MNITSREKVKCLVQCLTHGRHSSKDREGQLLEGRSMGQGPWLRDHVCTLVLSSRAHTGTNKHLVNECRPPTLRKACDELFHDSEKLPFALVGEYIPKELQGSKHSDHASQRFQQEVPGG